MQFYHKRGEGGATNSTPDSRVATVQLDRTSEIISMLRDRTSEQWGRNLTASDKPNPAAEQKSAERLDVARTAYDALVKQDADRVITLCDVRVS